MFLHKTEEFKSKLGKEKKIFFVMLKIIEKEVF